MHRPNAKDVLAGGLFLAFGVLFLVLAQDYPLGSARRMGPAYFPQLLALVLIAIGVATSVRAFLAAGPPIGSFALKALVLVSAGVLLFGLTVEAGGLAVATVALVLTAGAASPQFRPLPTLVLAVGLAAFCAVVFRFGLGLPFPVIGLWR
jgi:hypothetical protein